MPKKEAAQKYAPWIALVIAVAGAANAYFDSRAARRKGNEAKEQVKETREWTDQRAERAYHAVRQKLIDADRARADLYYRLSLVERDLDEAISMIGTEPPRTGVERRDYEAKLHALKEKPHGLAKMEKRPADSPAPLSDWDTVQKEAPQPLPWSPAPPPDEHAAEGQ